MTIREILTATDFSPLARTALDLARALAATWGARLRVAHVVPPVTDPGYASEQLAREAARVGGDAVLLRGRTARELVRYAREQGIDLIVMGTHGRTGISRAVLGSVAEQVIRLAPCPVVAVPGRRAAAVPPRLAPSPDGEDQPRSCVVCSHATDDLICARCRDRIRAEAFARKLDEQRGSPH
jgi:nucleotide-binding universal stress UspA family protein